MHTAIISGFRQVSTDEVGKGEHFARMLQSIELLHRRLLDLVTVEIGRVGKTLSSVQALILCNANGKAISLGELQASGHYEGASLADNVGKLVEGGYIMLVRPQWDKRSSLIELTAEGRNVAQLISQYLESHAGSIAEADISEVDLVLTTRVLSRLDHLWSA
jgi:DNA-binding MarR family transcriptional regulator